MQENRFFCVIFVIFVNRRKIQVFYQFYQFSIQSTAHMSINSRTPYQKFAKYIIRILYGSKNLLRMFFNRSENHINKSI